MNTTTEDTILTAASEGSTRSFAKEYCDACGTGAHVRATHVVAYTPSELAFCKHHFLKNEAKFADMPVIKLV